MQVFDLQFCYSCVDAHMFAMPNLSSAVSAAGRGCLMGQLALITQAAVRKSIVQQLCDMVTCDHVRT